MKITARDRLANGMLMAAELDAALTGFRSACALVTHLTTLCEVFAPKRKVPSYAPAAQREQQRAMSGMELALMMRNQHHAMAAQQANAYTSNAYRHTSGLTTAIGLQACATNAERYQHLMDQLGKGGLSGMGNALHDLIGGKS